MTKILLLANKERDTIPIKKLLEKFSTVQVNTLEADRYNLNQPEIYLSNLPDVDVLISLIGPLDVDLAFEAFCDALEQINPTLKRIVMVSTAGIDKEIMGNIEYPGIKNVKEFLNQQRYAVKLIDETEIDYTIFRPGLITDHRFGNVELFNEGEKMPVGSVSRETLAKMIVKAVVENKFINQSVGLIEKKEGASNV